MSQGITIYDIRRGGTKPKEKLVPFSKEMFLKCMVQVKIQTVLLHDSTCYDLRKMHLPKLVNSDGPTIGQE